MVSRSFTCGLPVRWHLLRAGHGAEIRKVRDDVDRAFVEIEGEVDVHTDPIVVPAWDGSPFTSILLVAGHKPALYEGRVNGTVISDDGNGFYVATFGWRDPDIGSQVSPSDNIAFVGGPVIALPINKPFFSDGTADITVSLESFGNHPTGGVTLYLQLAKIG